MNELLGSEQRFRLSYHVWCKRHFNPSDKKDILEYNYFLKNNRWKNNCPFVLEWPHLTITDMIRSKLIDQYIDKMVSDAE